MHAVSTRSSPKTSPFTTFSIRLLGLPTFCAWNPQTTMRLGMINNCTIHRRKKIPEQEDQQCRRAVSAQSEWERWWRGGGAGLTDRRCIVQRDGALLDVRRQQAIDIRVMISYWYETYLLIVNSDDESIIWVELSGCIHVSSPYNTLWLWSTYPWWWWWGMMKWRREKRREGWMKKKFVKWRWAGKFTGTDQKWIVRTIDNIFALMLSTTLYLWQ